MSLPFVGARATCPCNKINNKSISSNDHIAENFWGNSSFKKGLSPKVFCYIRIIKRSFPKFSSV
jgi:hypothetical protein